MKHSVIAGIGIALLATTAWAQTAPTNSSTTPPAIATNKGESNTTAAPVPGSNSFTESEARNRLEKFGYTNVSDLKKDDKSIWHGKATKDGKSMDVSLDYQGNITSQ
jgi:hypothetical protein